MENFVGLLLPPVIDLVNTRITNTNLRFVVSMLISAVLAFILNPQLLQNVIAGYNGGSFEILVKEFALIWVEAQVVYKLYWEKSDARVTLQSKLQ